MDRTFLACSGRTHGIMDRRRKLCRTHLLGFCAQAQKKMDSPMGYSSDCDLRDLRDGSALVAWPLKGTTAWIALLAALLAILAGVFTVSHCSITRLIKTGTLAHLLMTPLNFDLVMRDIRACAVRAGAPAMLLWLAVFGVPGLMPVLIEIIGDPFLAVMALLGLIGVSLRLAASAGVRIALCVIDPDFDWYSVWRSVSYYLLLPGLFFLSFFAWWGRWEAGGLLKAALLLLYLAIGLIWLLILADRFFRWTTKHQAEYPEWVQELSARLN